MWTNSCCGHPLPGEPLDHAVIRRLSYELGLTVERADLMLPAFTYRAVMPNGIVEHELCPVYRVTVDTSAIPNPDEVDEIRWMPWKEFADGVLSTLLAISPWCREQVPMLNEWAPIPWTGARPRRRSCRRPPEALDPQRRFVSAARRFRVARRRAECTAPARTYLSTSPRMNFST